MKNGYFCHRLTKAQTSKDYIDGCQTNRMTQIYIDSIVICRQNRLLLSKTERALMSIDSLHVCGQANAKKGYKQTSNRCL
jgi:hypothetical protein